MRLPIVKYRRSSKSVAISRPVGRDTQELGSTQWVSKRGRIEAAIGRKDKAELVDLCQEPGGLLEDSLRRQAWPILLDLDVDSYYKRLTGYHAQDHPCYEQIAPDVVRSIRRFPPSFSRARRLSLEARLLSLIARLFVTHPNLHYYQGFHDICLTVLLVVDGDEDLAFRIMERLSSQKLRPFMEESVDATVRYLKIIYPLIGVFNHALRVFLERSQCGVMFLLPWCLTWFGHNVSHAPTLSRLFDLFLASDDFMPVYLAAAVLVPHQEILLLQECSLSGVHSYLGKILSHLDCARGDMELRIAIARNLMIRYPPKSLTLLDVDSRVGPALPASSASHGRPSSRISRPASPAACSLSSRSSSTSDNEELIFTQDGSINHSYNNNTLLLGTFDEPGDDCVIVTF